MSPSQARAAAVVSADGYRGRGAGLPGGFGQAAGGPANGRCKKRARGQGTRRDRSGKTAAELRTPRRPGTMGQENTTDDCDNSLTSAPKGLPGRGIQ